MSIHEREKPCLIQKGEQRELGERESKFPIVGIYLGGGRLQSGEYKANVDFAGMPTSARVVNALVQTPEVSRVVALVPDERLTSRYLFSTSKEVHFYEAGETFIESARRAFLATFPEEDIIVVLSDVPFIKPSSLSRLVYLLPEKEVVIPAVYKRDIMAISNLHRLHFMSSKEGYFHLGSAVLFREEARDKVNLERMNFYYRGKSFRTNPRAKLEAAIKLAGVEGLAVAVRIWISANLQHKGRSNLDVLLPSPAIDDYQRIISRIIGIPVGIAFGSFVDLFLDFDYADDASQLQRNYSEIENLMNKLS